MGVSKPTQTSPPHTGDYGAHLTTHQFLLVVLALALGTILEWFDFFSFSLMNSTLTAVFFPSTNPTLQQISFWGVFFVGFVARPIGSVIFGHIGDTRGRRLTLLLSIVFMAVPTVLIGCLPAYEHIGVAAPVLLALLRLVQGVAMGGEFGSALVYLHEIASRKRQGFTGSIGFASAISGCMLGVLVVLILETALTPQQMLVFGWRLPFLMSVVSASAALALRLHMPEPHEFIQEKEPHEQAANQQHCAVDSSSSSTTSSSCADESGDVECGRCVGVGVDHDVSTNGPSYSTVVLGSSAATADPIAAAKHKAGAAAAAHNKHGTSCSSATRRQQHRHSGSGRSSDSGAGVGCCASLPVARLLRWHWAAVLLQCAFEAWVSCSFYTLTTWLPLAMTKSLGIPTPITRGMLIVNLMICVLMQLVAGQASDKGMPRMWSAVSVYVIAGAIIGPILLYGMRPGQTLGAVWVLHALLLALVGWVLGIIPASCSPIYPASVRTTGFNLAHNMSMSWLGGLSPTIVTALTAVLHNKFMAPTILLVAAAGVSLVAGLILVWYAPASNTTPKDSVGDDDDSS